MDAHQLDTVLLVGTSVLLAAILGVRLSVRAGLPSLLVYLTIGVVLGESGLGIEFDSADTAHALGFAALIVILAEGGLTTKWEEVRPAMRLGIALATCGVAISVTVVAVAAHYLLGLEWELAVLLGAVTSPTDAAAVFSVLRTVPLKKKLLGALEAESGLNDAPTVLLVVLVSSGDALEHGPVVFIALVAYELVAGVLAGIAVGVAGARLMRRVALPASGLYPLTVMALAVFAYAGTSALHASGFAAVYVAALVLGNSELPHRNATRSFAEGIGWLAQIGLFVMLGLLASPGRFELWHVGAGLVAGLVLTFVARPCRSRHARPCCVSPGGSRHSWRGRACGVRCRSCSPPSRCPRASIGRQTCSTWSSSSSWCSPLSRHPPCPGSPSVSGSSPSENRVTSTSKRRRSSGWRQICCRSRFHPHHGCTGWRSASYGCPPASRCP